MSEALRTIILPHWKKDSGIDELIEMLDHRKDACWDQDTLRYRADFLKKAEYDLVITEAAKCQNDFSYAARNFFKIVTKQSEDTPFSLWESQELVLERMYEIKAKGKPQKLMVIKARQLGLCLDPDTKVLTADLRWVRIDDIQPDQELVGVDEMPLGEYVRQQRQLHTCTVMACREVNEEAYRLTMDNGEVLIATGPHRFLCKRRSGSGGVWRCVNHSDNGYRTSSPIVVGDEIRRITTPWDERQTFEDGWFGGLLDGEGSARKKKRAGAEVGISQVAGPDRKSVV